MENPLTNLIIAIKGAGEMASGVAWRLYQANFRRIFLLETSTPMAVRRRVAFSEAIYDGLTEVEGVQARRVESTAGIYRAWEKGSIAVGVDPQWHFIRDMAPHVVVDAILAKRNLGTHLNEAPLVIGLGPGFTAGLDVHFVVETNRGHNLGKVITAGTAEPNTGIPGSIGGFTEERVLRAPQAGVFLPQKEIGDTVQAGEEVAKVGDVAVHARIGGVIRGLLRSGTEVKVGTKLGDIDPRLQISHCFTISDKARAVGGGVLEAILRVYNRP